MSIWRTLTSAGAVAAALVIAGPASASQCGPAEPIMKQLQERYGEVPTFTADAHGVAMVMTISPAGSWTFLGQKDGVACVIAAGDKWAGAVVDKIAPAPQNLPTPALLRNGLLRI